MGDRIVSVQCGPHLFWSTVRAVSILEHSAGRIDSGTTRLHRFWHDAGRIYSGAQCGPYKFWGTIRIYSGGIMLATILAGHTAGASILRGIVGTQMRATSSVACGYYPKSPGGTPNLSCPKPKWGFGQNSSGDSPKRLAQGHGKQRAVGAGA